MTRKDRIIDGLDIRRSTGLEIGPLTTPIVEKSDGKIFYADHMSADQLRKKYANEPVDPDQIVDVDYVLGSSSLKSSVKDKRFDYVIASHVIEHVPDIVRWLEDVASILKPGGILALAIPNKKYTFDITREDSTPAEILGAYIDAHTKSTSASMYDFAAEYRKGVIASEVVANPLADPKKYKRRYSNIEAWEMTNKNAFGKEYVDSHCFVFTPYSFMEILKKLIEHDLLPYEVASFYDTVPGELEFTVSLKKIGSKVDKSQQLKSIPALPKSPNARELEAKNIALQQQLHEVEQQRDEMLVSKSWKVTKPMRKAVGGARNVLKPRKN